VGHLVGVVKSLEFLFSLAKLFLETERIHGT
jgi:hypothetical protein